MRNGVPDANPTDRPLAHRSVERALARRRAAYADEVERLVAASFRLIRERGELEPRVSESVTASGLSNQAFYRHFRSKDELLRAVLDDGVRQLGDYLRHRMERATDPVERVRVWIDGLCRQALDCKAAAATRPFALSRARLAELFPDEVARSEAQLTGLLRDAIAAARDAGSLRGADPERDAQTIYSLAMGWMERKLAQPGAPGDDRADALHLIAFAMHGLARDRRKAG
jgi:AcrR family transcriptional regulator